MAMSPCLIQGSMALAVWQAMYIATNTSYIARFVSATYIRATTLTIKLTFGISSEKGKIRPLVNSLVANVTCLVPEIALFLRIGRPYTGVYPKHNFVNVTGIS